MASVHDLDHARRIDERTAVAELPCGFGEPAQRVDVKGRLMLTRKKSGGWKIFGYDLAQNARTTGEGTS